MCARKQSLISHAFFVVGTSAGHLHSLVPLALCPLFSALYWTIILQHPSFWGNVADLFLCSCCLPSWLLAFAVVRDHIARQTLISVALDYSVSNFYIICDHLISLNLTSLWHFWFKSDCGVYVARSTSSHCSLTRSQSRWKGQEYLSPNEKHVPLLWAGTNYCKKPAVHNSKSTNLASNNYFHHHYQCANYSFSIIFGTAITQINECFFARWEISSLYVALCNIPPQNCTKWQFQRGC